jgi:hypothetical protein
VTDARARAERFADLFRAVYLTFHRRDGPRSQLPGASRAVLEHLALAGPLTIGEAAAHMSRAHETGALQSFDERFERMTAWQARRNPGASRQEIERQTLDYMATMSAWRDHPRVAANRAS